MGSKMVEAKIVCDSLAPSGVRLTTFVLTYPRFVHSEFLAHRMFSRNASSSRAIPVKKQIQMVIDNPAIPLAFTKNKPGMQGGEVLNDEKHYLAVEYWLAARDQAVCYAKGLAGLDVHKQYANRILEPFAHITVVCTATDYANFFALRCHSMAQPEICLLAEKMYDAYQQSAPNVLAEGQWHLPFITSDDYKPGWHTDDDNLLAELDAQLIRSSVARCARVSYLNHEGKQPTLEEDNKLYDRLVGSAPIHASPAEHQAIASDDPKLRSGNFRGWIQYRQTLLNQNIETFTK